MEKKLRKTKREGDLQSEAYDAAHLQPEEQRRQASGSLPWARPILSYTDIPLYVDSFPFLHR